MRTVIKSVLLDVFVCSLLCGCDRSAMRASQEADAHAVWEVRLAVQEALRTENTDTLMKLFTEDATFYVPNAGMSTGKEQIQETHEQLFEMFDDIKFEFKRLAINFPTPDVVIEDVSYVFTATGLESHGRDMTVLVRRNGRWLITAVLDLIPLAPAESVAKKAKVNKQDDIKAIRKLFDDFCEAHKYNNGSRLADFYTDDAMLMPSDEPIVSGKAAIASRYQQDIDKFTAELTTTPDEIDVSGNLAFVRGTFTIKLTPKDEGEKIEITFKAVSILRKGTDGSWKLYCDIWNSDAPLPPKPKNVTLTPPHQFELILADNPKKISEQKYQVGWIRAFLPNNESHSQRISVEMDEPDANWTQWGLTKQDVNFDGYMDIGVHQHGGAKWGRLHLYLYDPTKMEFYTNALTKQLSELTFADFRINPATKQIKITRFLGADLTEYSYQISDNHLTLCGLKKLDRTESSVSVTVATVCMNVKTDTAANLETFAEYIKQASHKGAQLIVFPEIALQQNPGWLAPQVSEDEMAYVHRTAETIPGPSTAALTGLSKKYNIHIIFGMTEKSANDDLYNTSVLLGPDGVIGKYRKQHIFSDKRRGGNEELFWKPGDEMGLFETPFGRIGIMTCIEMEDHFGGELADIGADILVTTTAWRGDIEKAVVLYERYTKSNAFEAHLWHIVSNQVGPLGYVTGYGHSRIINPKGKVIADTEDKEGMVVATINLTSAQNHTGH